MKPILVSVALAAVVASCVYHEAAGPNAITTVPEIAGCQMFPQGIYDAYTANISQATVSPNSAAWLATYPTHLHANFGYAPGTGMPYNVVPANQPSLRDCVHAVRQAKRSRPVPVTRPQDGKVRGTQRWP